MPLRMQEGASRPITLTQPTQAECEQMGVRDWPDTVVKVYKEEEVAKGAIRYVLEGTGTVNLPDGESVPVGVGSLVKVTAEDGVALRWVPDDGEMLLLTPEYQGPPLLVTAGGFVLACAALIAATATGL